MDESIQEHFQVLITNYNEGPEDQEHTFIVQANLGMDIMPGASDPLGAGRLAQRALFLHRDQFQNTYRLYLQIRAIISIYLPICTFNINFSSCPLGTQLLNENSDIDSVI